MTKRVLLGILAVFVAWSVLDFIIHGVILRTSYEATEHLWRPMEEMKMGLMYLVVFISAVIFVSIYARFFRERTPTTGLKYGLLYGVGVGAGMGYGTFSVMPIPYEMALVWFLGTIVKTAVGGILVGLIISDQSLPVEEAKG